jgi:hypothetical protein
MQLGITPQDRGKEQTMAAAGIGDALDAREIVSFDDGFGGPGGRIRHRSLEDLALLGALRQDLPDILAKSQGHAIAAATQTFRDVLIGPRGELLAEHYGHVAERARRVCLEQLADRRKCEVPRWTFLEHAKTREHAHDAIERGRMCASFCSDLLDRFRCSIHVIGDAEPCHR